MRVSNATRRMRAGSVDTSVTRTGCVGLYHGRYNLPVQLGLRSPPDSRRGHPRQLGHVGPRRLLFSSTAPTGSALRRKRGLGQSQQLSRLSSIDTPLARLAAKVTVWRSSTCYVKNELSRSMIREKSNARPAFSCLGWPPESACRVFHRASGWINAQYDSSYAEPCGVIPRLRLLRDPRTAALHVSPVLVSLSKSNHTRRVQAQCSQ